MKKLVIKVLLYFVSVMIIGSLVIYMCTLIVPQKVLGNETEFLMWNYQYTQTVNLKNKRLNAVIGDSRGMASLDPDILGNSYINFSLGGGTFYEGYISLKRLLTTNRIDTLVMCYGQFHYESSDVLYYRTIPFHFVDYKNLKLLMDVEKTNNNTLDAGPPNMKQKVLRILMFYRFPLLFRGTFISNLVEAKKANLSELASLKQSRGFAHYGTADSCTEPSQEALKKDQHFIFNPIIGSYLDSINVLVKEKNIVCYLVIPAQSASSYYKLKGSLYDNDFKKVLKEVGNEYPDITIINSLPYMPDTYFGDAAHPNAKGAAFFSKYVAGILKYRKTDFIELSASRSD